MVLYRRKAPNMVMKSLNLQIDNRIRKSKVRDKVDGNLFVQGISSARDIPKVSNSQAEKPVATIMKNQSLQ